MFPICADVELFAIEPNFQARSFEIRTELLDFLLVFPRVTEEKGARPIFAGNGTGSAGPAG